LASQEKALLKLRTTKGDSMSIKESISAKSIIEGLATMAGIYFLLVVAMA
jgi:hypothetical protein